MVKRKMIIGSKLIWLKETTSTNTEALNLIKQGKAAHGLLIGTDKQTAGRGQRGNKWESEANENLTMSLVLMPDCMPIQSQFYLNMGIALGISKALQPIVGENLKLKWANDIYYGNKKLGGILIENAVQKANIAHSIVGIGINVNQTTFDKLPNPISLHQITGKFYNLHQLAVEICEGIEYYYQLLVQDKKPLIRKDYINSLLWKDEWRFFDTVKYGLKELKILDVAPNGLLITEDKNGTILQFSFGELKAVFV